MDRYGSYGSMYFPPIGVGKASWKVGWRVLSDGIRCFRVLRQGTISTGSYSAVAELGQKISEVNAKIEPFREQRNWKSEEITWNSFYGSTSCYAYSIASSEFISYMTRNQEPSVRKKITETTRFNEILYIVILGEEVETLHAI